MQTCYKTSCKSIERNATSSAVNCRGLLTRAFKAPDINTLTYLLMQLCGFWHINSLAMAWPPLCLPHRDGQAELPCHASSGSTQLNYTDWNWFTIIVINKTSSSAVAKMLHNASCLSVVNFNSTTPRAQFFIISYFGFGFTSAYNSILFCCLRCNVKPALLSCTRFTDDHKCV